MNKKLLIVGNWKCNPVTQKEAEHLFVSIKKEIKKINEVEVVVCPPSIYSFLFKQGKNKSKDNEIQLGAQNCFWENKGSYTGELSSLMLKDFECKYILIGHSERRDYFKEADNEINKKIKSVLKNRLKPILCVGEKSRDSFDSEGKPINEMSLIISEQVEKGLAGVSQSRISDVVIAYEPVWAIGTGIPCLPDDAMKAALLIKKTLTNLYSRSIAEKVKILYGGSVISQNAVDYIKSASMDGLLIGGASLNASEFVRIINKVVL